MNAYEGDKAISVINAIRDKYSNRQIDNLEQSHNTQYKSKGRDNDNQHSTSGKIFVELNTNVNSTV